MILWADETRLQVQDEGDRRGVAWGMPQINPCVGAGLPFRSSDRARLVGCLENEDGTSEGVKHRRKGFVFDAGELLERASPVLVK